MTGRWTARGDRPADHGPDCICPACFVRLELVSPAADEEGYAGWCAAHGEVIDLAGCGPCGTPWDWNPNGGAA